MGVPGASWGRPGASWGPLGASRGRLGASWGVLGASWGRLGASWGRLGASWDRLGPSLGRRGPSWGRLGAVLGSSSDDHRKRNLFSSSFRMILAFSKPPWRASYFAYWSSIGAVLGPLGHLDASQAILRHIGGHIGLPEALLDPSWAILGAPTTREPPCPCPGEGVGGGVNPSPKGNKGVSTNRFGSSIQSGFRPDPNFDKWR